jgi:hypothetical protein
MPAFWIDGYQAHFARLFKKPFDIQVFHETPGLSLKLATHDQAGPNFRVYTSLGLADILAEADEDDFGEVILFADAPDREVPELFVNALFFILRNDIALGSRFAIGGIEKMRPGFARRYRKSALYFTVAPEENEVQNGEEKGRVYQAYFITPDEEDYLEDFGSEAFAIRWEAQAPPQRNSLRRVSCLRLPPKPGQDRHDTNIQPGR